MGFINKQYLQYGIECDFDLPDLADLYFFLVLTDEMKRKMKQVIICTPFAYIQ